jgi:DNA-directed RNA polymerase subunit RPC12/RpoP
MDLSEELRRTKVCRFCLALPSANLALTEIYGKPTKTSAVPLPLQIMAATGMEVYESDGLPTTICFKCRVFTLHVYKFKQMARKAEEQLRKYPSTGVWPDKLRLPFEQIVVEKPKAIQAKPVTAAATKAAPAPQFTPPPAKQRKLPTKPPQKDPEKVDILSLPIISIPAADSPHPVHKTPPKILNKCPENATNMTEDQIQIVSVMDMGLPLIPSTDGPALVMDTQVYACTECERSFPLRQLLDIHIKSHQRERNFPCQWCDKHFFSKYDLAKHTVSLWWIWF